MIFVFGNNTQSFLSLSFFLSSSSLFPSSFFLYNYKTGFTITIKRLYNGSLALCLRLDLTTVIITSFSLYVVRCWVYFVIHFRYSFLLFTLFTFVIICFSKFPVVSLVINLIVIINYVSIVCS